VSSSELIELKRPENEEPDAVSGREVGMTCLEFERDLPECVEGVPSPEQQAHLNSCPTCSGLLLDLNSITSQASLLSAAEEPSAAVWNALEQRLRSDSRATAGAWHVQKPDSGHTGTISITIRVRRASLSVMKPRIQCVLTQWNPGFIASGGVRRRSYGHDQRRLTRPTVLVVLM